MKKVIIILGLLGVINSAGAGVRYRVVDLSEQAAGSAIIPATGNCINDNGDVAGHGMPTDSDPNVQSKPFLYDADTQAFINLGNIAGSFVDGYGGNSYSINNAGQVVGRNCLTGKSWDYRPFLFQDSNNNNSVDSGEMISLTVDQDFGHGWAEAINENGQVVGFSRDANEDSFGWVWTDLNENDMPESNEIQYFADYYPNSINDDGDIILSKGVNGYLWSDLNLNGVYDSSEIFRMELPEGYSVLISGSYMYDLTFTEVSPVAINNSQVICGAVENSLGKANGFYWKDQNENGEVEAEEYTILGTALLLTHVRAMNNKSEIVGGSYEFNNDFPYYSSTVSQRAAFIWTEESGMINLNLVSDCFSSQGIGGWLSQAEGINDKGQIVASGWFDYNGSGARSTGEEHTFILTPYLQGDISGDGKVDFIDFGLLSKYFQQDAVVCPDADIDDSGTIDIDDLVFIAEDWMDVLPSM